MTATAFPERFLWGTATSSYQIEGAVDEDGRGPSIWDVFARRPGAVWNGDTGDVAVDHYHRLDEDLDLLRWLGVGAYRFSVAWPRVQPDGAGAVNQRGLDFYRRLVDGLLERAIEPVLTLYHWDLPQALQDRGGWANRDTVGRFEAYAAVVARALGDRVRWWTTLNEPWCSAFLGYAAGVHAPGVRDGAQAVAAAHHLLLAHGRAVGTLRPLLGSDHEIGIALNLAPVRAASDRPADREAARLVDGGRNRAWLDPILRGRYPDDVLADWDRVADLGVVREGDLHDVAAPIDWLGINYYHPLTVAAGEGHAVEPGGAGIVEAHPPGPRTAMAWPIGADGLRELVDRVHTEYGRMPIVVTENGAAFDDDAIDADGRVDDRDRIAYLAAHLQELERMLADGIDVRGYFLWTFLDNFEWAEGYRHRFGIVAVDPETLARHPKASAHWYRQVIASRGDLAGAPA